MIYALWLPQQIKSGAVIQSNLHLGLLAVTEADTDLSTSVGGQAERKIINIYMCQTCTWNNRRFHKTQTNLPGSVLVKASWHSGGLLLVEANAWSSAEVDMALSNNLWPVSNESRAPGNRVRAPVQTLVPGGSPIFPQWNIFGPSTNQLLWEDPVQGGSSVLQQAPHSQAHLSAVDILEQRKIWEWHLHLDNSTTRFGIKSTCCEGMMDSFGLNVTSVSLALPSFSALLLCLQTPQRY